MEQYIAVYDDTCSEAHDTPEEAVSQIICFATLCPDDYKDIVVARVIPIKVKKPGEFVIVNDS